MKKEGWGARVLDCKALLMKFSKADGESTSNNLPLVKSGVSEE